MSARVPMFNFRVAYKVSSAGGTFAGAKQLEAENANDAANEVMRTVSAFGLVTITRVSIQCEAEKADRTRCQRFSANRYCPAHAKKYQ